ncbi:phosphate regulon sensor protein PhoR [Gracilibacillus boraciitolerans JCM 21714]|uniref:histidine kinase n=1 Tax=Gracilibacillus boraciitolerans JCM 21714 TaxID=1298598 RepID=W4VMI9_9BACI|nr:ATP-binding protein [Gracilibacillus boraciitolerans]GAE94625.1 phosphate regulon sensor protein PhoR [Gracilibacillus boraciitolerans JCM 21714]
MQLILNYSINQTETQLVQLSEKYANQVTDLDDSENLQLLEHLTEMTDTSAVILDQEGTKLLQTNWQEDLTDKTLTSNEIMQLKRGETIVKEFTSNGSTYLKVAQPIINQNGTNGSVVLFSSFGLISNSIHNIIFLVILASLGAVVLAIGFTFFISKKLGAPPLIEMEKVAKQIAEKKNFSLRVDYKANDEIGSLAHAINHLSETLERYQTNRNEFFSNITHELKTPLTYVKGYANAVRHEMYQNKEEKDEFLEIIENETDHISDLMDDLMDLSKIEEGKIDLNKEDININKLAEEMLKRSQFRASEKGLTMHLNQPENTVYLFADKSRLDQVLTNLVENAVRYTEKGKITLTVQEERKDVIIRVEDTGIGIKQEDIPYLFERFYRVDKSRSRANGGTGLGLSIVKNLVEMHDGSIQVESEIDKGTAITLRFPTEEEKQYNALSR